MTDIDRRAALLTLLSPLMVGAAQAQTASSSPKAPDMGHDMDMTGYDPNIQWMGDEEIAMLMYPGMTVMDLIGPQSWFGALMGAKVHLIAKTLDPVTSDVGVTIVPNATFETCPKDLTVLFAPGGSDGMLAAAADPATLAFMADRGFAAGPPDRRARQSHAGGGIPCALVAAEDALGAKGPLRWGATGRLIRPCRGPSWPSGPWRRGTCPWRRPCSRSAPSRPGLESRPAGSWPSRPRA